MRSAGDLYELQSVWASYHNSLKQLMIMFEACVVNFQYRFADMKGIHRIRLTAISA